MARILTYEEKNTWIHRLSGATKLIFFLLWSAVSMISYDTRILIFMFFASLIIFYMSKTKWKQIRMVFRFIMLFLVLNLIGIFLFAPQQGTLIYGTNTPLMHLFGPYTLTKEQLFYEFNVLIKYFTVIPAGLMFIVTTNPSEFASSLNKIGVSYKIGYAVAIALRYIPDVQDDFVKIKHAQEARGIEMSEKAPLKERIKSMAAIIFPLVFSGMERIDTISNAMELRGFGKYKKRSWYSGKPFKRNDYIVVAVMVVFSVVTMYITFKDGSRFYNPFVN